MTFRPRVLIRSAEILHDGWSRLTRYKLSVERRDGGSAEVMREVHDHGDGAAVLPYDPKRDCVLLVRQFRLPSFLANGNGMIVEVCAGLLDGDEPDACARKEAEEELGYRLRDLELAGQTYTSPGSVKECVWLYTASYSEHDRVGLGGGSRTEDEDIEVLEVTFGEAWRMLQAGEICDAKTIILMQRLKMARR